MTKYIYKLDYSIMINSAVKVWAEETPATKYLLIVPGFKTIVAGTAAKDTDKLISLIKTKFSLEEVEVEEFNP